MTPAGKYPGSPDGRSVAFAARKDCDGCGRIATVALDGSAQPAIVVSGGTMLNGKYRGETIGVSH